MRRRHSEEHDCESVCSISYHHLLQPITSKSLLWPGFRSASSELPVTSSANQPVTTPTEHPCDLAAEGAADPARTAGWGPGPLLAALSVTASRDHPCDLAVLCLQRVLLMQRSSKNSRLGPRSFAGSSVGDSFT